jgi:hypothetical protein
VAGAAWVAFVAGFFAGDFSVVLFTFTIGFGAGAGVGSTAGATGAAIGSFSTSKDSMTTVGSGSIVVFVSGITFPDLSFVNRDTAAMIATISTATKNNTCIGFLYKYTKVHENYATGPAVNDSVILDVIGIDRITDPASDGQLVPLA